MAIKKERIFSVGWDGYYEIEDNNSVPEGGIVLRNVTHGCYNLAKEIGVIKIWVTVGDGKAIPLTLGPTDFEISDYKSFWVSSPKPPQQFSEYPPVRSVSITYTSKNPVVEGGSKIKITQTYIFTQYSDYPAHEPGGVLTAARIFPLIKFI